jgi:tetratricopeptide (TPR) repeat protein
MITKWLSRVITDISSGGSSVDAETSHSVEHALSLEKQGAYGKAITIYHELLTHNENNLDVHLGLGRVYGRTGDYDKAISHLESAIQQSASSDEAYYYLGNVYKLLGDTSAAILSYRNALSINPVNVTACSNLCRLLLKEKEIAEIKQHLKPVLEIRPIPLEILSVLGSVYKEVNDYKKAYHFYKKAYSADPASMEILKELVSTQTRLEKYQEAVELSEQAVRQHPESAQAYAILGYAYLKSDMFESALDCFDQSLEINPDDYSVHNNRGITLQYMGQIDEAIPCYEKAYVLNNGNKKTLFYKSLAYLTKGDFARGWHYYQYRTFPHKARNVATRYENCDLDSVKPDRMLVRSEQGLGDEIMFASCLPDVLSRTGKCYIECDDKLVDLFRNSFPDAVILSGTELARSCAENRGPLEVDCQMAIGDLPQYFRNSLEEFPYHSGYLKADQERIGYWRERLAGIGEGKKIGLSWTGGTVSTHRRRRSIALEKLLPILEMEKVQFISLQYTECREEIDALEKEYGVHIHHWQEAIDNYSETAALISALDLVITVQTAAAHLGGALGRETWILLNSCPEWRYMVSGECLPWYPGVRLFRQVKQGDWDDVVTRVTGELQGYILGKDKY